MLFKLIVMGLLVFWVVYLLKKVEKRINKGIETIDLLSDLIDETRNSIRDAEIDQEDSLNSKDDDSIV